ncbi:MAG: dihydroneopterin aldolase [Burkholderiales bacterium]
MDTIFIGDLRVDTVVGVYEWERRLSQTVQIDFEIGLPDRRSGQTDRIADTIDYGAVIARLKSSVTQQRFELIEALAEHIANIIINEFSVPWTRVSVTKFGLIRGVKRLGISIERGTRS